MMIIVLARRNFKRARKDSSKSMEARTLSSTQKFKFRPSAGKEIYWFPRTPYALTCFVFNREEQSLCSIQFHAA